MKKITLSFSVLAVAALFTIGCKKKVTPEAPVADTDLQSSIDATYALFTITDAEVIASFVADNSLDPTFYLPAVGSAGTVTPVQDTAAGYISFGFNQTTSVDGRFRDGTIFLDRGIDYQHVYNPNAGPNSRYYRSVGFVERLTFSEYKVDGWKIITLGPNGEDNGTPALILNTTFPDSYNPATTNLTWAIKGNFKMKKGNDSMYCKLDLVKTLLSTGDKNVFVQDKKSPIVWAKGKVSYSGTVTGTTPNMVPFTMVISPDNAIIRDFTCSPDPVTGVAPTATVGTVTQRTSQYHPFINGVASFTTSTKYPRQIYYGGSEASGAGQCDNSGAVLIKGISYPIDFRKE